MLLLEWNWFNKFLFSQQAIRCQWIIKNYFCSWCHLKKRFQFAKIANRQQTKFCCFLLFSCGFWLLILIFLICLCFIAIRGGVQRVNNITWVIVWLIQPVRPKGFKHNSIIFLIQMKADWIQKFFKKYLKMSDGILNHEMSKSSKLASLEKKNKKKK